VTRYACSNDLSGLVLGQKDVQSSKPEVPGHDKKVSKHLEELLRDAHVDGDVENSVLFNGQMLDESQEAG